MGTRSTIVIAMNKDTIAKQFLLNEPLPKVFEEADEHHKEGNIHYWMFIDWKWYESDPSVAECIKYLHSIRDEDYGLIEDNEDYGLFNKGAPWNFAIQEVNYIQTPFGNY